MQRPDTHAAHWRAGFLFALATAGLWGTLPIALKKLLGDMEAQTVVWYRFGSAALFLAAVLRLRGPILLPAPDVRRWPLLAVAVLGFSVNNLTFMLGLEHISPTAAQVMIQLAPLLVVASGVLLLGESFGGLQYIGAPMLAGGILLFFHDRLGELVRGGSSTAAGIALIGVAAITWAAFAVAQKKLLHAYGSVRLMLLIYGAGALLLSPLARPADAFRLEGWQSLVLFYACLTTVLGYGLFSEALKRWEASRVGAVVAVTPLFTWALTQLGARVFPADIAAEAADGWSMLGGIGVVCGSALAALGRRSTASAPTAAQAPPPAEGRADPQPEPALPGSAPQNQCPSRL